MKGRRRGQVVGDALTYLVFAFALLFFVGPLLWEHFLPIRAQQDDFITSLRLIPESPTLENHV